MGVQPYRIRLSQGALDELKRRLGDTRWPDAVEGADWGYGTNLEYLKDLVSYWKDGFDWRFQERRLNQFSHYLAGMDRPRIHFIHERGRGPDPLPLLLTHGWPSTFFEMTKIIPLLANPADHGGDARDAFHVVVPSLPGYGFSDRPTEPGMTLETIADAFAGLMVEELGYRRFAAHGGDIGAGVTTSLARRRAESLLGIHLTAVANPELGPGSAPLTHEEEEYKELCLLWDMDEGAYDHQQSTRPQTLAYGLNDSPVGLAAWIVEKVRAWSDCGGDLERRFTKDELLTNLTIYWVTQTIGSSVRLYYEHRRERVPAPPKGRVHVPTGVTLTVEPGAHAPREWAERTYNLHRWTELPRGGHFANFEEPELMAEEIRAFFRPLRGQL